MKKNSISIILPAKNEATSLNRLLPQLQSLYPAYEILVVDDGSIDSTAAVAKEFNVQVITHQYSMGNGAAVKSGARLAKGEILVFMDADGQHDPTDISNLLNRMDEGYDMVVGARRKGAQANFGRGLANKLYNRLATWITGKQIMDLTSGMRAANAKRFREFLYLLPNGFSYPTTITMAFFRNGYSVAYHPISTHPRLGKSHIRIFSDGIRFFIIIFRVGTLYSPLKIFLPVSLFFFLVGLCYYGYTFIYFGRFTNMSALLFITSILVFLIGLVSEQITSLLYQKT